MVKLRRLAAALAACAAASCNSISSDQEQLLSTYLENAAQYYDGGHFQRAYQQWDQALAMDSDNEKARLGQAMALYQMGRAESVESIKPLTSATQRLDALRREDFGPEQWKIELGAALAHQRWCDILDRKLRLIAEQERQGVAPEAATVADARREFAHHLDIAEAAFRNALEGPEKEPRDRLTCWIGLSQVASWRNDLPTCIEYAKLYLAQILRSKQLWKDSAERYPREAPIYEAKHTGAAMQEAELRDLMGAALFKLGRTDEAEAEVMKVVELFPQRASAFLNRGILRQMRGEYDLARGDFRKFLSLTELPDSDPSILEAARRLAEVEARLLGEEADAGAPAQR